MKKYLFGLGAMLVGAGLMFVLMHGEVSADNPKEDHKHTSDFLCESTILFSWSTKAGEYIPTKEKFKGSHAPYTVQECRKEDKKDNTTCYIFMLHKNPAISCVKG